MKDGSTLKNAAALRRITYLKAEVIGGIRWESKANVMTKFEKMKRVFQQVENDIETSTISLEKIDMVVHQQTANYLGVIKKVIKKLQYRLYTLHQCSEDINDLFDAIEVGKTRAASKLFRCQLKKTIF